MKPTLKGLEYMRIETSLAHLAIEHDWSMTDYRVYLFLCEHRNIHTNLTRPLSCAVIAEHTEINVRSVRRSLASLEACNAIIRDGKHRAVYTLPHAKGAERSSPPPPTRPTTNTPAVSTNGTGPKPKSLPPKRKDRDASIEWDDVPF